jgi:alpha-tubulin suppressor-like RCC1 family protein
MWYPTKIPKLKNIKQISCGHHSAALTEFGELYFWGTGAFGSIYEPRKVIDSDIIDVSIGGSFGVALDKHGLIWSWGSNNSGKLGSGDYEPRPFPFPLSHLKHKNIIRSIRCGGTFAIAIG